MNIALIKLKEKLNDQQTIAEAFGLTQPAISQWFRRDFVPHDQLLKASELTGLTVEEIVKSNMGINQ